MERKVSHELTHMTSQTWEQRFEEQFQESEMEDGWGNYSYVICTDKANLKNFIQSELSQQRKEIIEEIAFLEKDTRNGREEGFCRCGVSYYECDCYGYNLAIRDIITNLSREKV